MKPAASIDLFLTFAKQFAARGGIIVVSREQTYEFMSSRAMTQGDVLEIVQGLSSADCFDGPEPDRDERWDGWTVAEFSPVWRGEPLYVKLSIKVEAERVKCLSLKAFASRLEVVE